ncbi:MAG: hypothetical protein EBT02_19075 [Planctomycetia bacterium]|nr:hypothetical protein [Planctomycetia bacterium]
MIINNSILIKITFACFLFLASQLNANACPNCRDATRNSPEASQEEQYNEAKAFNKSIYLMAGMPFAIVTGFGIFLRKLLKKNQQIPNQ